MKKIIFFISCVLLISLANAQKSRESSMLEKLNLKPIESVMNEQIGQIDKETKALRANHNEYFESDAKEASEIALSYLQAKRDVYKLSSNPNDIRVVKIQESPSGKYVYFRQYLNDIPVFATNFTVYVNNENVVTYASNEFRNVSKYKEIANKSLVVSNSDALKIADKYLNVKGDIIGEPGKELVYFESMDKGLELAWRIYIISMEPRGAWRIFVSANDGHIIHVEDIRMFANGSGKVFNPNPLVSANVPYGGNYVHNNGATNPHLEAQLMTVTLRDLTESYGYFWLNGPYCRVVDFEPPRGHNIPALEDPNDFNYNRNDLEFGAVMSYYYVDLAARRVLQLGYWDTGLNGLKIDPHGQYGWRDAQYIPSTSNLPNGGNYISLGSHYIYSNTDPFVPACEDADVILHEYGHAIQWKLGKADYNLYSKYVEVASVLEGSSDYWAASFRRSPSNDWAVHAKWFNMDYGWIPRRLDLNSVYPTDYLDLIKSGKHYGGQIWSSALMKIWGDLGRDITDQLFLETHLLWKQDSVMMRGAATAFMKADVHLNKGRHLCQIYSRFQEHGLIDSSNGIEMATNFTNQTVNVSKTVFGCNDVNVQNVTVNAILTITATGVITIHDNVVINSPGKLILMTPNSGRVVIDDKFDLSSGRLKIK